MPLRSMGPEPKLLADYNKVNDEIHVAETNIKPTSQEHESELRKCRLTIKDQIARVLAEAG